jgi:hypothetical protein
LLRSPSVCRLKPRLRRSRRQALEGRRIHERPPGSTPYDWVGTGEANNQRSVGYGDGVYCSDDAGRTWRNLGLKTSEHIGRIVIDPRNSQVVYVAAYGPSHARTAVLDGFCSASVATSRHLARRQLSDSANSC